LVTTLINLQKCWRKMKFATEKGTESLLVQTNLQSCLQIERVNSITNIIGQTNDGLTKT